MCSVSAVSLRRVTLHLMLGDVLEVLYTNVVAGEIKECIVFCRSFSFVFLGFAGLFPGWCHLLVSFGNLEGLLPRFEWWPRWYIDVATQLIRSGSGGVSRAFHIPGPTPNLV